MPSKNDRISICAYLRRNSQLWDILAPDLLEAVQTHAIPGATQLPGTLTKLFQAAIIISREKKRQWYLTKGYDYIEGLNLQNTEPHIYQFLKRCKIHTIHELLPFIQAIRKPSGGPIRLKDKRALQLIIWWDFIGHKMVKSPNP